MTALTFQTEEGDISHPRPPVAIRTTGVIVDFNVRSNKTVISGRNKSHYSQNVNSQVINSQVVNSQVINSQVINSQVVNSQVVNSQVVNSQVRLTVYVTRPLMVEGQWGKSEVGGTEKLHSVRAISLTTAEASIAKL